MEKYLHQSRSKPDEYTLVEISEKFSENKANEWIYGLCRYLLKNGTEKPR